MVNKIVNTTPITTKYTPKSKIKAVPKAPITTTDSANQTPVINGSPINVGSKPLKKAIISPVGIRYMGLYLNKATVLLVLYAKECNTKAIEAISPPTKPPPDK